MVHNIRDIDLPWGNCGATSGGNKLRSRLRYSRPVWHFLTPVIDITPLRFPLGVSTDWHPSQPPHVMSSTMMVFVSGPCLLAGKPTRDLWAVAISALATNLSIVFCKSTRFGLVNYLREQNRRLPPATAVDRSYNTRSPTASLRMGSYVGQN